MTQRIAAVFVAIALLAGLLVYSQMRDEPLKVSGYVEADEIRPRKSDVSVDELKLVWCPWRVDATGIAEPSWSPPR